MIERLLIKDSIAFKAIDITPSRGFNIFSGISGSGKSVLMESILALFGLKDSNAKLIEATISQDSINLENSGILDENEITISIIKNNKVKYFINHQSISKKHIKELFSEYVKYISSYTELKSENLLNTLDLSIKDSSFKSLLDSYKNNYTKMLEKKIELSKLEEQERNIASLREFAAYEITQIESINPKVGEYEELLELKKNLSKKEKILEKIAAIKPSINGFSGLISLLDSIGRNNDVYADTLNEIESIINEEEEKLQSISNDEIEEILNRIEKLSSLVHKYGSIEASLEHLAKKKADLESYDNLSFNKTNLQNELESLLKLVVSQAKEIRNFREKTLDTFLSSLESYCAKLLLSKPKLVLEKVDLYESGSDRLEIYLKDSSIETLSSGEFNRLKLAIMCLEVEYDKQNGILILDEIDANLSGSESEGVAQVLELLSRDYQIFAISHQSHMPSFANNHYLVQKEDSTSSVILLTKDGRIKEIARMISGLNITNEALEFAKEKLQHL